MRVLGIVCDPPVAGRDLWSDQIREAVAIGSLTTTVPLPSDLVWSFANVYDGEASLPILREPSSTGADGENEVPNAIVISGSVYDVTDVATRPWIAATADWLRRVHDAHHVPMLGICFGHQLLCYVFGGVAGVNPNGWELGTHTLSCASVLPASGGGGGRLFHDLPPTLDVQETHAQSVLVLPQDAVTYGGTAKDPNQLVHYTGHYDVYGVQYHPEYSARFMHLLRASDDAKHATSQGALPTNVAAMMVPGGEDWRDIREASPVSIGVVAKFLALAYERTQHPPPSVGTLPPKTRQKRILAVVCGRPRTNMTPWPSLIRDVALSEALTSCGGDVSAAAAIRSAIWDVVSIYDRKEALPPIDAVRDGLMYDAVIFSGSGYNTTEPHGFVDDACSWIRALVKPSGDAGSASEVGASSRPREATVLPMFGICFGHQLIAKALGGQVDFNPRGPQLGTYQVQLAPKDALSSDPILRWMAAEGQEESTWLAQEVHYQSILALPAGAKSLATAPKDPNQVVRFASGVYGVQFHPEYPLSYMEALGDHLPAIREAGEARASYYASLQAASPQATSLVSRFLHAAFSGEFCT